MDDSDLNTCKTECYPTLYCTESCRIAFVKCWTKVGEVQFVTSSSYSVSNKQDIDYSLRKVALKDKGCLLFYVLDVQSERSWKEKFQVSKQAIS